MKPSKEEYEKALETIRAYSPERFVKVEHVDMKGCLDSSENMPLPYVVEIDGHLQLVSQTGEVIGANIGLSLKDTVNEPLIAEGTFYVGHGRLVNK